LTEAVQEAIWLQRLIAEFCNIEKPIVIYEDNQNCIRLLKDEKSQLRTKHMDIKYNFVRDMHHAKDIEVNYCPSQNMIADLLTKPLASVKMRLFSRNIGLV